MSSYNNFKNFENGVFRYSKKRQSQVKVCVFMVNTNNLKVCARTVIKQ